MQDSPDDIGSSSSRGSRSKATRGKPPKSLTHVFADEFADDWVEIADQVCGLLKLPDLTTRSGLKKVHSDLPAIQQLLEDTFKHAKRTRNTKVMGAVIAIYTKMCMVDSILQTKILDRGFYRHLVTLVEDDDARHVALRALNSIVFISGKQVPSNFLGGAPAVLKHALKHLEDPTTLAITTGIFAHGASAARALGASFDVVVLVRALLSALKGPHATRFMFEHAMMCFAATPYDTVKKCEHMYPFVTLMAALMHSKDFERRCQVVCNLTKMHLRDRDASGNEILNSPPEDTKRNCISTVLIANNLKIEDLPETLRKAADKHGRDKLFMTQLQRGRAAYAALFVRYNLETDPLLLGHELASLIYDYRFALPDILCPDCGHIPSCKPCISQSPWVELAQRCYKSLREQDSPSKQDLLYADMLEWKTLCYKGEKTLYEFCNSARERHPQCPLFYYLPRAEGPIIAPDLRLRLAKKGLKCSDIPEWLRIELTGVAVGAAWTQVMGATTNSPVAVTVYPWLVCARSDAKWILDNGPPDGLMKCFHLFVYILSHVVIEGGATSFKAPSIQRAMKELEINGDFLRLFGVTANYYRYYARFTRNLVEAHRTGKREWAELLICSDEWYLGRKAGENGRHHAVDSDQVQDSLSRWIAKFDGWDESATEAKPSQLAFKEPFSSTVPSMICSWCSRPSAVLKKCGGCGQEKYCDSECQRLHWKTHREHCQSVKRLGSTDTSQPATPPES